LGLYALLQGCGTYEPPKPGVHQVAGEPRSDLTCEYAPPTARVIKSWNCRKTANLADDERRARETLESISIPPPPPP
jgi:hypothetical protein